MKLTHPNSKQAIEVADEHAETYLSQGWVEATKAAASKKADAPTTKKK